MQSLLKKGLRFSETRGFRVQRERERPTEREERKSSSARQATDTLHSSWFLRRVDRFRGLCFKGLGFRVNGRSGRPVVKGLSVGGWVQKKKVKYKWCKWCIVHCLGVFGESE